MRKPKAKKPPIEVTSFQILPPILLDSTVKRQPIAPPEDFDADNVKLGYGSTCQWVGEGEQDHIYQCSFAAYMIVDDDDIFRLEADYIVAFHNGENAADRPASSFLEPMINATAWARFRDLFMLASSQAGMPLPHLPNMVEIDFNFEKITPHQPKTG